MTSDIATVLPQQPPASTNAQSVFIILFRFIDVECRYVCELDIYSLYTLIYTHPCTCSSSLKCGLFALVLIMINSCAVFPDKTRNRLTRFNWNKVENVSHSSLCSFIDRFYSRNYTHSKSLCSLIDRFTQEVHTHSESLCFFIGRIYSRRHIHSQFLCFFVDRFFTRKYI